MFALLGSMVGFFSSFAPDILNIFRDKKDKEHELKILRMQAELTKLGHNTKMEEIMTVAESREMEYIYKYADKSGVLWVDAFAGTVRPFLTYAFFALYAWIKVCAFLVLDAHNHNIILSAVQLWSAEDETIFAAIISFWFGSRVFRKKGA
jgi:hypothetical protein